MLILLSVAAYTFSLNDVSVPNRFNPSTPARSSEVNANFDTLASRINQNNDTLEQKFIRFSDLESGDSILEKCRIDTARIDHIRSNPEADSMTITKVDINGGTIDGTVIGANSAAAGTFTTVTASGAIAGSTINTGYGAYEIGQSNRTTDSPTFEGLSLNSNLTVGGSIIGSKASGLVITTNSIDGADDRFVQIFAGGGHPNRSGGIVAYGNESSGHGDLRLYAGVGNDTVAGNIKFESTALVAGKLGIQTTTPTEALDVVGNIKSSGNVSAKKQMADSARIDDTLWVGTTNATKLYDGWYLEGNYLCTLSGFTSTVTCTTYYVKCGKAVTLTFSPAAGTSNTEYINISTGLMPASIRPARVLSWKLDGQSFGGLTITDPYFIYSHTPANVFQITSFQPSNYKSILYSFSISYLTY